MADKLDPDIEDLLRPLTPEGNASRPVKTNVVLNNETRLLTRMKDHKKDSTPDPSQAKGMHGFVLPEEVNISAKIRSFFSSATNHTRARSALRFGMATIAVLGFGYLALSTWLRISHRDKPVLQKLSSADEKYIPSKPEIAVALSEEDKKRTLQQAHTMLADGQPKKALVLYKKLSAAYPEIDFYQTVVHVLSLQLEESGL